MPVLTIGQERRCVFGVEGRGECADVLGYGINVDGRQHQGDVVQHGADGSHRDAHDVDVVNPFVAPR